MLPTIPIKFLIYAGVITAIVLGGWYLVHEIDQGGQTKAKAEIAINSANKNTKIRKEKVKNKHDTQSLTRDELIDGMCKRKWVRDIEQCTDRTSR